MLKTVSETFCSIWDIFQPPPHTHTTPSLTQLVAVMQDVRLAQYYQTHTCMNLKQKCQNACIYYKFHLALWKQLIASFVRITNCNTKFCKSYRAFIGLPAISIQYLLAAVLMVQEVVFPSFFNI